MTAALIGSLDEVAFAAPEDRLRFFGDAESKRIRREYEEARELRAVGQPGKSCDVNLFMGFFFDGTRNNYDISDRDKDYTHSNVARLYGAYPGQSIRELELCDPNVATPSVGRDAPHDIESLRALIA